MLGRITAECVCRKWNEDFTDQDTGEIVTIERNEVIVPNHKVLDQDDMQQILFYIELGEIKDVLVTNQMRIGDADTQFTRTYIVQVEGELRVRSLQRRHGLSDYDRLCRAGAEGLVERASWVVSDCSRSRYNNPCPM